MIPTMAFTIILANGIRICFGETRLVAWQPGKGDNSLYYIY